MPRAHDFEPRQTFPLYGRINKLSPSRFETQLAQDDPKATLSNEATIQARPWLDLTFHTATGQSYTVSLEHGPGTRALFEKAFTPPPQAPAPAG